MVCYGIFWTGQLRFKKKAKTCFPRLMLSPVFICLGSTANWGYEGMLSLADMFHGLR